MPSTSTWGAAGGGALTGISKGARTFGAALEHVMGQLDAQERMAYQQQRDASTDQFREAQLHATEEGNRIRRAAELWDAYSGAEAGRGEIVEAGYAPEAAEAPGPYGQMFSEAFGAPAPSIYRRGEYDPERDRARQTRMAELGEQGRQQRLTEETRSRTRATQPPAFNFGGAEFPMTPEGYTAAAGHGSRYEELPGQGSTSPDPAELETRRQTLVEGALRRMTDQETGEVDYYKLRDVLNELRRRPKTTADDLKYLTDFFDPDGIYR